MDGKASGMRLRLTPMEPPLSTGRTIHGLCSNTAPVFASLLDSRPAQNWIGGGVVG